MKPGTVRRRAEYSDKLWGCKANARGQAWYDAMIHVNSHRGVGRGTTSRIDASDFAYVQGREIDDDHNIKRLGSRVGRWLLDEIWPGLETALRECGGGGGKKKNAQCCVADEFRERHEVKESVSHG